MHKHISRQGADNTFELVRDGVVCFCPKTLIAMPSQSIGGMQLQPLRMGCNTGCPFASIEEKETFNKSEETGGSQPAGKRFFYVIECEGGRKEIMLDELIQKGKPAGGNGLVKTM